MTRSMEAIGAEDIFAQTEDANHLAGTARMGFTPQDSVVNADCRSWDIPNLWICDGSVFPTTGGVNPSLTIQAIALRTADRIKAMAQRGSCEDRACRRCPRHHRRIATLGAGGRDAVLGGYQGACLVRPQADG
ncbi:GMC family oxidoreductase [Acidocella sp. MX-AZ03]|uniref:GMC family oxidoreductase n=1 Tax=Acidocella sp. MX-AZ03 TaxID=2697363 RepID=UPI0022DE0D80|nr:GMC family oxidoreductase [Acidocella sp. MX-AZ03]WBO60843.1 GMC family oxidoreductase [Acidocella sp. MX-AZ03]